MRTRNLVTAITLVFMSIPGAATAQIGRSLAPSAPASCVLFAQIPPKKISQPAIVISGDGQNRRVAEREARFKWAQGLVGGLTLCLTEQLVAAKGDQGETDAAANPVPPVQTTDQQRDELLTRRYLAFRNLKQWHTRVSDGMTGYLGQPGVAPNSNSDRIATAELQRAYVELESYLTERMDAYNLAQPFSAELVTGMAFDTAGGNTRGSQARGTTSQPPVEGSDAAEPAPNVHLIWESKHFGAEIGSIVEASFSGKVGFQPALTLLQPELQASSASTLSDTNLQARYQEAFAWSAALNFLMRAGRTNELSTVFEGGQFILTEDATVIDKGGDSVIAIPVSNDVGDAAVFWAAGLEFKIFRHDLDLIHVTKGSLAPLFRMGLFWKHDTRFRRDGPLVAFDSPEKRVLIRFLLEDIPVMRRDESGTRTFALSFGVEYERGPGHGIKLPEGTRIILRGDLNLLKALKGERPQSQAGQ